MSSIPQRQAYGVALADYGDVNPNVVVLDADVSSSTLTKFFAERHPERFYNIGIAESNLVGIGAGLENAGFIPWITSFSSFLLCCSVLSISPGKSSGKRNCRKLRMILSTT